MAYTLAGALACSAPDDSSTNGSGGTGATTVTGGSATSGSGGSPMTGGAAVTGGYPGTGGNSGTTGGVGPSGGFAATGGVPASGGTGSVATGGNTTTGGVGTGGSASGGTGAQSAGFCPTDEPCRISPLGDSITEDINYAGGYRVNLFRLAVADGKDITFVGTRSNGPNDVSGEPFPKSHEGTSGISIEGLKADVVDRGKLSSADVDPHIILLHIGTNNMYGNHPAGPEALLPDLLDAIIEECPDALLVVSNLIPLPMNTSGISSYNAAIPAIVEERAEAGAHIIFVEQHSGFPESELEDRVHPTPGGYDRMGQVWYDAIEQYLP